MEMVLKVDGRDLTDAGEGAPNGKIYQEMAKRSRQLWLVPRSATRGEQKWLTAMVDAGITAFFASLSVYASRGMIPGYLDNVLHGQLVDGEALAAFRAERIKDADFGRAVVDAMIAMHGVYQRYWAWDCSNDKMTPEGRIRINRMSLPLALIGWSEAKVYLEIFGPVIRHLSAETETGGLREDAVERRFNRCVIDFMRENQLVSKGAMMRYLSKADQLWRVKEMNMEDAKLLVDAIWPDVDFAAK